MAKKFIPVGSVKVNLPKPPHDGTSGRSATESYHNHFRTCPTCGNLCDPYWHEVRQRLTFLTIGALLGCAIATLIGSGALEYFL